MTDESNTRRPAQCEECLQMALIKKDLETFEDVIGRFADNIEVFADRMMMMPTLENDVAELKRRLERLEDAASRDREALQKMSHSLDRGLAEIVNKVDTMTVTATAAGVKAEAAEKRLRDVEEIQHMHLEGRGPKTILADEDRVAFGKMKDIVTDFDKNGDLYMKMKDIAGIADSGIKKVMIYGFIVVMFLGSAAALGLAGWQVLKYMNVGAPAATAPASPGKQISP